MSDMTGQAWLKASVSDLEAGDYIGSPSTGDVSLVNSVSVPPADAEGGVFYLVETDTYGFVQQQVALGDTKVWVHLPGGYVEVQEEEVVTLEDQQSEGEEF